MSDSQTRPVEQATAAPGEHRTFVAYKGKVWLVASCEHDGDAINVRLVPRGDR